MTQCSECRQEMTDDAANVGCDRPYFYYEDGTYRKRSTEHFEEQSGRCHDCNAPHGMVHHVGCDAERCPRCGGQFISCDCDKPIISMTEREKEIIYSIWTVLGHHVPEHKYRSSL